MRARSAERRVAWHASGLGALVLTMACGGGAELPAHPTLEDLRRVASEFPDDPEVQRRYALGEVLMDGSDPARVAPALDRALELAPGDETLLVFRAQWADSHGEPAAALDAYLAALDAAAASSDPLHNVVGELALKAIAELEPRAPHWRATVEPRLGQRLRDRGSLGPVIGVEIARTLIHIAFLKGDRAEAERLANAAGCLARWRVAGPFGPRDLLGFDRQVRPDGDDTPLADTYRLGPTRGQRATRTHEASGCAVHLGQGAVADAGTTFAEAEITAQGGEVLVHLETPNAVELFIDGESVVRLDRRRRATPRLTFHGVPLSAGSHRLSAKITTRHPNPILRVAITDAPLDEGPENRASLNGLPPVTDLLTAYLRAALALGRGDPVEARETLASRRRGEASASTMLHLRAAIALADPLRPTDITRDEGRRLYRMARRRDDTAWVPRYRLATLGAADGRVLDAIRELREMEPDFPRLGVIPMHLAELLLGRGWTAQADQAVARARALLPGACAPLNATLAAAKRRERWAEVESLAGQLIECNARSSERYRVHLRRRRWDEALEELVRLQSFEPTQNRFAFLSGQLEIARAQGDDAKAQEILSEMAEAQPQSATVSEAQADALFAGGDDDAADAFLAARLEDEPSALGELRFLRRAMTGEFALSEFRVDGREALRAFEASGRRYEEPQVLVLDYTVVRVFDDGSSLELTHNLWKVQSDEVVDERGEFSPPEGARILQLHTIKADGRLIEPDTIEGKETISLPQLAPGDYVEYEYLRPRGPSAGFPGGYLGDRFFFRSFEIPYDLSQLTLVLPEGMEATVDPRGPAPDAEERRAGDLRVLRWTVRESRPFRPEPTAVPAQEWIPSINVGIDATWPRFVDSLLDALADKDIRDPAAVRLVTGVLGDRGNEVPEARARVLYDWVLENVEENGDFFGLAPAMLAARTGSRGRVLRYLLDLNGIETDLLAARSIGADTTETEVADGGVFRELVLRAQFGEETTYLSTDARGTPFGYLPPAVRGEPALVLELAGGRIRLPAGRADEDRHLVETDVHLKGDGGAEVEVLETFHGAPAIRWRNDLEEIAEATLEQRFEEAYVSRLVPGAELLELRIEGRNDSSVPLTFRYRFDVRSLGRREGSTWLVPGLFPSNLASQYAQSATRETPQLVAPATDVEITVRLHPVSGRTPEVPEGARVAGPSGALATVSSQLDGGILELRRRVRVPIMRMPATDYPELARFCRSVDQLEARELRVPGE